MNRASCPTQWVFLVIAAVSFFGCGQVSDKTANESEASGVIEGSPSESAAKYMVEIFNTAENTICSGTLLSDQLVLTSGHCADGKNKASELVLVFENKLPTQVRLRRQVIAKVINPRYNPDARKEQGDIAILKFAGGLPEGYEAAPILPSSVRLSDSEEVFLSGFGKGTNNNLLSEATVKIADANWSSSEVEIGDKDLTGICHEGSSDLAYAKVNGELYLFGVNSREIHARDEGLCDQDVISTNIVTPEMQDFLLNAEQKLDEAEISSLNSEF